MLSSSVQHIASTPSFGQRFARTLARKSPRKSTPSERRKDPRLAGNGLASIRLDHADIPIMNWSRGGFAAVNTGDLVPGQYARFTLSIRSAAPCEASLTIDMDALIVRATGDRICGRWRPLIPADTEVLAKFATSKASDPSWRVPTTRDGSQKPQKAYVDLARFEIFLSELE